MSAPLILAALAAVFFHSPLFAYNTAIHDGFVSDAAAAVCEGDDASPLCAELGENLPFLRHGAIMEDEAAKGHDEIFNYVEFKDEESWKDYGPCREYVFAGKAYMYCNHYFFVDSYLAGGGEGACGVSILGATDPRCTGESPFRWESARQRGLRLWKEKVIPNYFGGKTDSKARAYYWLGRVAHLLGDVSVPAHLVPHKIGYIEFEHRSYEFEAGTVGTGPLPRTKLPDDLSGLFVGLAKETLAVHDDVRSGECRRDPRVAGCEAGRASPAKPLQSFLSVKNIKLTNDLMKGKPEAVSKPEILEERVLARRQLEVTKPLTVAFTVKLLEIFGAQAGLTAREMAIPAPLPDAEPALPLPPPDFDGTLP